MEQLIRWIQKKIRSWFIKEPETYERGSYYEIEDAGVEAFTDLRFKLLKGRFKGTIFWFTEMNVDGDGAVKYKWVALSRRLMDNYQKDSERPVVKEFDAIVGHVLEDHLNKSQETYRSLRKEILNDDEDREDYFEEPIVERTIRKGKSVSKSKKRVRTRQVRKAFVGRDKKVHRSVQPSSKSRSNTSSTPK